jgi:hypothetical protein
MRHASTTTTLDLYSHLYPADMDLWEDRLDAAGKEVSPRRPVRRDDEDDDLDAGTAVR